MAKAKFDLKKALAMASKKHLKTAKEKAATGGFEDFDDGRYIMRCEGGELGQSASSNRFQATMFWKFVEGDYKGKTYRSYQGLENEDGWTYFLRDLGRLGYDTSEIEDFSEVLPILKELKKEKPVCRVTLKTNGEFQNLRIQRLLDDDEVEEEDEDEEDDDAPKKKSSKKPAKKSDDEDDDEEEESDDDESEDDDDEESDEDESEDDDDEEEEEDDTPKKKSSKKPAKKKSKSDDEDEEDDDDDEESEDDDEEEDDDAEDEVALSIGSTVKVRTKAGVKKGEVTEVLENDNKIKVKFSDGKVLTLSAEKIVSVEDVPSKKKAAPAKKKSKK